MGQYVLPCSPKAEKVFCGSVWGSGYFLLQPSEVKSTRQSQLFTSHVARKPLLYSPRSPAAAPGFSLTRLLFFSLFAAVLGRGLLRASGTRKVPTRCKAVSYCLWEQQHFLLYFIRCIQNTRPATQGSPLFLASLQVSWRSDARWLQCSGQVFLQSIYWDRRRWCPKRSFMAKGAWTWPQWCHWFHSLHAPGRSRGCLWCPRTQLGVVMLPPSPPGPGGRNVGARDHTGGCWVTGGSFGCADAQTGRGVTWW